MSISFIFFLLAAIALGIDAFIAVAVGRVRFMSLGLFFMSLGFVFMGFSRVVVH